MYLSFLSSCLGDRSIIKRQYSETKAELEIILSLICMNVIDN